MTHTRHALGRLRAGIALVPRAFVPPPKTPSQRLVEMLQATDLDRRPPTDQAMEALRRRLHAFYTGRDKAPPTRRELRDAAWLLWNGAPQGAEIPGLMAAVVDAASASPRRSRSLIEAWLRDFVPGSATVRAGGGSIRTLLASGRDPLLDHWRQAQTAFAMFDADAGPARIGAALLTGPQRVEEVLAATGLDDAFRASGGYMRAILRGMLAVMPKVLRGAAAHSGLERAFAVLAPDGTLRFGQELRGEVGRGLLAAWLDGGRPPEPTLREPVRDFLLRHLGDPRTRAPMWTPVGEAATALMRQWLARASLAAFFDLIAEHALDHQWRYRQAFWSAYLERGAIEDAWLALGSRVHSSAKTVSDLAGAFGRLEGGGVDSNQSVLLMRIGPLVLCEWSHNGKLRAWPAEWKNAPALYQSSYSRDDLTGKGLPFPPNPATGSRGSDDGLGLAHNGSDRGLWQGSAAELLARRAGIRITPAEWIPR
jgi:hypothetical protein